MARLGDVCLLGMVCGRRQCPASAAVVAGLLECND